MENIKEIIAENLVDLRKQRKMTQLELAEKLNYSDKTISRWEKGDITPDIETLCKIASIYGVTFHYLTTKGTKQQKKKYTLTRDIGNKLTIALLAVSIIWLIATIIYVYTNIIKDKNYWTLFIWSFPISAIVGAVFNKYWGTKKIGYILSSFIIWSILISCYVQLLSYNLWPIFLLGIPSQIAIILWSQLKR